MHTSEHWAVVGAGFHGLVAARELNKRGKRVTIIESSLATGGVLRSFTVNGSLLDKGCHLFTDEDPASFEVFDDLYPAGFQPVTDYYGSVYKRTLTKGYAIPDLARLPRSERSKILRYLSASDYDPSKEADSLYHLLMSRYGPVVAERYATFIQKVYRVHPANIASSAFGHLTFSLNRIKATSHEVAMRLKRSARFDNRIAASRQPSGTSVSNLGGVQPIQSFYPRGGSLAHFCDSATRVLESRGVRFLMGNGITLVESTLHHVQVSLTKSGSHTFDRIYWAAPLEALEPFLPTPSIKKAAYQSALILVYFLVPNHTVVTTLCYLHHFDPEVGAFRFSFPSNYAGHASQSDRSYIICEIPTEANSPEWCDPSTVSVQAWDELRSLGLVTDVECPPSHTFKLPKAFRVPRPEQDARCAAKQAPLGSRVLSPGDHSHYSKPSIIALVQSLMAALH